MLEKFIAWIDTNRFIKIIGKANAKLGIFNPIIVLLVFLIHFSSGTVFLNSLKLWSSLVIIYSFVFSMYVSYAYFDEKNMNQSIVIGLLSVLMFSQLFTNVSFLPILSVIGSLLLSTVYKYVRKLNFKSNFFPPAVLNTLVDVFQLSVLAVIALMMSQFFSQNIHVLTRPVHLMMSGMSSIIGLSFIIFSVIFLWSKGYHGATLTGNVIRIFFLQMMISNISAFVYGLPIPYFAAETFFNAVVWIGGSGTTIGLSIALKYMTKSKDLKDIGDSAIKSSVFNINEEIIFGVPIVENKKYLVPFFLAPLANAWIAYFVIRKGWATFPLLPITWVAPAPLAIFVSALFDWRSLVLGIVLVLMSLLIYLPFMIKDDRERSKLEQH